MAEYFDVTTTVKVETSFMAETHGEAVNLAEDKIREQLANYTTTFPESEVRRHLRGSLREGT